ncbi:preprotein translocase, SecA subunit [secondary endosymbiont of Heteropsylla cubana]|uniref:Protein translocase subunit SecA n=1 Tax=secondary endosymbiont of Heteropsylla cubana TaxID=134287 RepID=J3TGQ7_9ENTR|nr:preprotein translocase subunit SecA [secondary endosymbiont of Heteropsylla cubana]AFP85682.1 preprotein translocase, SecA subunit [secondary endosymbiont of Heteropsylla cubana]
MLAKLLTKILGTRNDRVLKRMRKMVNAINQIEPTLEKLNNKELSLKTLEFRQRISEGITVDILLPEAFAVVREASKRVSGMRHFDVQLLGGIVLHEGRIAEMRTGEGKTLTATLPAYLNALTGDGVHIVTVNDYLAQRDAKNNRSLFEFLELSVGINLPGLELKHKRAAYNADITYGTNNEYGFDYLRDNMAFSPEERVQRTLHYALVDEVDSILIDEARTPLIISGSTEDRSDMYRRINKLIPYLVPQEKEDSDSFQGQGHFSIDEKSHQVHLTERGLVLLEKLLVQSGIMQDGKSLYAPNNIMLMQHVTTALQAHVLFSRNVDYIIKNDEAIIVDEHTGRTMPGRRWSDGLHQAVEAKENITIQNENQTLASITFQNYFRLYKKLSGMTGTAETEACEFKSIYNLDTVVVPTNRPMKRKDFSDLVYMTEKEKINAIITDIKNCTERGQPVLVGTISIEKSELLSKKLEQDRIVHKVLNAKFHAMEADIIAQAGKAGAVTIATNMAGRGTDIVLGGSWQAEVLALKSADKKKIALIQRAWQQRHEAVLNTGGLHIIGTERHESRRIDNQLRGRAGRQGDPGSSRFYLSMEDSLMRIFASDRVSRMMCKLGMKQGEAIEHPWVTKAIANAQRKVESRNFDIRKQLLEYDDVANDHRRVIYAQRNELLEVADIRKTINSMRDSVLKTILNRYIPPNSLKERWDIIGLERCLKEDLNLNIPVSQWLHDTPNINEKALHDQVLKEISITHQRTEEIVGIETMRTFEKNVMLQTLDFLWKEHLAGMDYLRQGIHLRGYAQKDPKQEYKRESFNMFSSMLESLKYEVIFTISKIQISMPEELEKMNQQKEKDLIKQHQLNHNPVFKKIFHKNVIVNQENRKVGRNDLCPCNSGRKFKHCHGKL